MFPTYEAHLAKLRRASVLYSWVCSHIHGSQKPNHHLRPLITPILTQSAPPSFLPRIKHQGLGTYYLSCTLRLPRRASCQFFRKRQILASSPLDSLPIRLVSVSESHHGWLPNGEVKSFPWGFSIPKSLSRAHCEAIHSRGEIATGKGFSSHPSLRYPHLLIPVSR